MSDDKLSFLDDKPTDPNAATEAAQAADQAPVETPEIVEETPAQVTEPPPQREDHNPLLPKYLETYNELRDAKRRIAEFEEKQKDKAAMPDPVLDPDGYSAEWQRRLDQNIWDVTARTSEIAARRYYGVDVVTAAFEALKASNDPVIGAHIRRSPDPWQEIVNWHHQQQLLAEVGNDVSAYKQRVISEWQAEQAAAQAEQPPPVPTTPAKAAIPPPSLSKAPASKAKSSDVPIGPGQAFDGAFAR